MTLCMLCYCVNLQLLERMGNEEVMKKVKLSVLIGEEGHLLDKSIR